MTVHVVVPTFRESALAGSFFSSWSSVEGADLRLYLVNGNPGDETSSVVETWRGELAVEELKGSPDLYWTGLVNLGLRRVLEAADPGDRFLLTNIDVRPSKESVRAVLAAVAGEERVQVAIPVVSRIGKVVSSGVQVKSWALSWNRHLGEGLDPGRLPESSLLDATYLPTRFLLCPVAALREGLFPDEERLPHYCADYEFTNRLRKHGFRTVLFTGTRACLSEENTGFDTFLKKTSLWSRLRRAGDIKCPYNLRYRYRFVRLAYPFPASIPGLFTHFTKILLEILLGGRILSRLGLR